MLKLSAAASFFDRTPVLDAYTGEVLCMGQVDPYDDSKRDAGAAYRRVLSVTPGQALPAHGAVSVFGSTWLLGRRERDGLEDLHRDKYVLQPADSLVKVSSLTEFLSGSHREQVYAAAEPVKTGKEAESSSDVVAFSNVYVAPSVAVSKHEVLWTASQAYLVLLPQSLPSGLRAAYSLLLEYGPVTATINSRVFDPVQGKHQAGASVVTQALRVRWQSLFEYQGQLAQRYQEGDDVLVLPAGTTVDVSSTVSAYGRTWSVLAVDDLGGAVTVHARS